MKFDLNRGNYSSFDDILGELEAEMSTAPLEFDVPSWYHDGQKAMFAAYEGDTIALGAVQSGKSAALPAIALRDTIRAAEFIKADNRHGNFIMIGPTLSLATAQMIPHFRQLWEEELRLGKYVGSPKPRLIVSPEGARRLVGSAATNIVIHFPYGSDSTNVESMTAYGCAWDEWGAAENSIEAYNAIMHGRLTIARNHGFGKFRAGTTPYEWGWQKDIVDRVIGLDGELLRPISDGSDVRMATNGKMTVVNWPAWMHPSVSKEYVMAIRDEEGLPDDVWRMRYLGMYTRPAGAIYDCWGPDNEIDLNQFPGGRIPEHWHRFVGIDFGLNNTAAIFLAAEERDYTQASEPTGRFIIYDEYLAGGRTAEEHVREILARAGGLRRPIARGGSHSEEVARDAFRLSGLTVCEPKDNNVEGQILKVYAAIKTGNLVACRHLKRFMMEVKSYSRELGPDGHPVLKIRNKEDFHVLDALRYIGDTRFRNLTPQQSRWKARGRLRPTVERII